MTLSRSSVTEAAQRGDDEAGGGGRKRDDPISIVYHIIRNHAQATGQPAVKIAEILPQVRRCDNACARARRTGRRTARDTATHRDAPGAVTSPVTST